MNEDLLIQSILSLKIGICEAHGEIELTVHKALDKPRIDGEGLRLL